MRFQDKSFLLKTDIRHSSADTKVEFYDENFNQLDIEENSMVRVTLPSKLIIRLINVVDSELLKISLASIKLRQESLLQILEYKFCKYKLTSIRDLEKFQSTRSTSCKKDGYFVLNLFHRNPFAIHLFVGNTINFKL